MDFFQDRSVIDDAYEESIHDQDMGGDFFNVDGIIGGIGGGMQGRPPLLRRRRVLHYSNRIEISENH